MLFTDLVGSTRSLARLGDDEAEELRRAHRPIEIPPRQPRVDPPPARADPPFVDTQSTDAHVGVTQPAGQAKRSHPLRENPLSRNPRTGASLPSSAYLDTLTADHSWTVTGQMPSPESAPPKIKTNRRSNTGFQRS